MKKILLLIILVIIFSAVNVYAQTMSKYGYPVGYKPNKTAVNKPQSNYNSELFPQNINPAILSVNNMISVSYSDLGLNYGEYANNGYSLSLNGGSPDKYSDTENGFLNGFKINVSDTFYNFYNEASFSYYSGNDSYTGSLQGGTFGSLINTTNSKIYNFNYKLGYMIPITNNFVITPYGELGWHIWKRDNIGGNNGQNEHYSNWLAMIGVLGQYAFTPKLVGDLGFGYGTTFNAQVEGNEIDMTMANYNTTTSTWSYSYADTTWGLGSKSIYDITAGLDYKFYNNFHIFGNVKYERFKYGQSALYNYDTQVNKDNVYYETITTTNWEPNSVTNEIIYSIGIGYSF